MSLIFEANYITPLKRSCRADYSQAEIALQELPNQIKQIDQELGITIIHRTDNAAESMNRTDLAYRKTAVEGASGFGLLIALYDTLAGNLRRAAAAQRRNDLEDRCHEVKHALR